MRCLTWQRSVGRIEAWSLYYAITDKANCEEVSSRYKKSRDGVPTKCSNQREMNVVPIVHLINTFRHRSIRFMWQYYSVILWQRERKFSMMFSINTVFQCLYIDIVKAAASGALQIERGEGQVDSFVDRHLNGPQAVHVGFIVPDQVGIRRTKHSHGHWQVATTPLCWTCRRLRNTLLTRFSK